MEFNHYSVLLNETIENLNIKPDGIYVDGTLGGGGHAYQVASRLSEKGRLIGIDQDADAIAAAGERLKEFGDKITIIRSNYANMKEELHRIGVEKVDGIVLDLGELTEIIRASIPMKVQVTGGHPAKRTFQAIRIELNKELEVLQNNLDDMIDLLNPGGRICIITFHSLEDRIVKTNFKRNENPCTCPSDFPVCVCGKKSKGKVVTRKPILPSEEELEVNSRSKSAKLRVFERV